ncbi:FAD-dependent sensor of blue light [Rhodothalassium salexigens DSM 2132]|uniref:FAD-dependent sensor of blue light n=1 Tax=Rhodothalassium salexigens DSM 2132 TaxID=1188247 RepID=A0A4R2PQ05_RHOSA|nr:BLUF domain-containing protein [Rhodothalassium salexigens]MBB4210581.1 hypothetical protein [Rhodothalassium salexigens DSM 2132]MBK1639735.1 blue light sensor protein [Rhodothalassium salexigens DSM 2132]TCP37862.1 FAD-dependent sensor of blue light [Rhodothalassium salexigens DSM 2132]
MTWLSQIAYISKSNLTAPPNQVKDNVTSILRTAQSNNATIGVTGALLYSGGYFCQVLEGETDNLEELFETIQMDSRHKEITVLYFDQIDERGFSDWSMAFAGIEEAMRFDIQGIKDSTDQVAMRDAGRDLLTTLHHLIQQHQGLDRSTL